MEHRYTETRHIMYVCQNCAENDSESCGHFDRDEIRITPDGEWLCDNCYEYGEDMDPDVLWSDLPMPPEHMPK